MSGMLQAAIFTAVETDGYTIALPAEFSVVDTDRALFHVACPMCGEWAKYLASEIGKLVRCGNPICGSSYIYRSFIQQVESFGKPTRTTLFFVRVEPMLQ